ncbi:MAG: hypothetical protein JO250_04740 [Armatimonadetes bacterium]|nr:hypothetical protein [Armatimonadota bacterium]
MSVAHDGQSVTCDGDGCRAVAALPVALRPVLSRDTAGQATRAEGWLFAAGRTGWRHFCPDCARRYLEGVAPLDREQRDATGDNRKDVLP